MLSFCVQQCVKCLPHKPACIRFFRPFHSTVLLKKKANIQLEELFEQAAVDNTKRQSFIQAVLDSTLYTLIPRDEKIKVGEEIKKLLKKGDSIKFVTQKKGDQCYVPVFTSRERLTEGETGNFQYMKITGRQLLEALSKMHQNCYISVNPFSRNVVNIDQHEMKQVLDEITPVVEKIVLKKGTTLIMAEPHDIPKQTLENLYEFCKSHEDVVKVGRVSMIQQAKLGKVYALDLTLMRELSSEKWNRLCEEFKTLNLSNAKDWILRVSDKNEKEGIGIQIFPCTDNQ